MKKEFRPSFFSLTSFFWVFDASVLIALPFMFLYLETRTVPALLFLIITLSCFIYISYFQKIVIDNYTLLIKRPLRQEIIINLKEVEHIKFRAIPFNWALVLTSGELYFSTLPTKINLYVWSKKDLLDIFNYLQEHFPTIQDLVFGNKVKTEFLERKPNHS